MLAKILIGVIAILHLGIAGLEMFAWVSRGPKIFKSLAPELFVPTAAMAANQGLYNAFLAAGLLWSLVIADAKWHVNVASCFLIFVLVAGLYGAATVSSTILLVQSVPAILALGLLYLGRRGAVGS